VAEKSIRHQQLFSFDTFMHNCVITLLFRSSSTWYSELSHLHEIVYILFDMATPLVTSHFDSKIWHGLDQPHDLVIWDMAQGVHRLGLVMYSLMVSSHL